MVENDLVELINIESELTISDAILGTNLRKLTKSIEKRNVIKSIVYLANRLSENFNVGKKLTIEQSSVMAMDLLEVFGYESLEDVVLMFKYARQGRIGDGKDFKLDSQTVFHKWIPEYLEIKAEYRENEYLKEKAVLNSTLQSGEIVDRFYQQKREGKERYNQEQKVIAYIEKITNGIDRIKLEELITEWRADDKKVKYISFLVKKRLQIKTIEKY